MLTTGKGDKVDLAATKGGHWHLSQPDYCMAREREVKLFPNVASRQPISMIRIIGR